MNVRREFASTGLSTASRNVSDVWPRASDAKIEARGPAETGRKTASILLTGCFG